MRSAAPMQTTKRALLSIVAFALASSSATAATGALLVPGAEDGAARDALASVATATDLVVAPPADTVELLNAAQASGLSCVGADVACWQQLAGLGGFQTVIIVTDSSVIVATPSTTTTAPRLVAGAAGLGPAVRRAVRQRGALQLGVDVVDAVVTVDGTTVALDSGAAVVDDLAVGAHVVAVEAAGHAPLSQTVEIAGGAVERPVLVLAPVAAVSSSPSPLFIAGVGALGVGAAVAAGAIGYASYHELQAEKTCGSTSGGPCNDARLGWLVAIGGGAVGLVGVGLTVLSLQ